jgi:hypothetical protein
MVPRHHSTELKPNSGMCAEPAWNRAKDFSADDKCQPHSIGGFLVVEQMK